MIELRTIHTDINAELAYVDLFGACFPGVAKFNLRYLQWLYNANPMGSPVGFDAWDGSKLAAHYVTIPMQSRIAGEPARVLLSLNTATHPLYQGQGLFTRLAERTYEAAAEAGYKAIIGVANANSTPGFVRKLGFQLVEPLTVKVGAGPLRLDMTESLSAQFRTDWSAAAIDWRCANPNNAVAARKGSDRWQFYARAFGSPLPAYAELAPQVVDSWEAPERSWLLSPLRLYIGLAPASGRGANHTYIDVPRRLRPSPLNFIYKPLQSTTHRLERGDVSFSFLDFDAY